jgi:hypothetical protein
MKPPDNVRYYSRKKLRSSWGLGTVIICLNRNKTNSVQRYY